MQIHANYTMVFYSRILKGIQGDYIKLPDARAFLSAIT